MLYVANSKCITISYHSCKNIVSLLGSQNRHSYLVSIDGSNRSLMMTQAGRNMSL
jgi:type II secretory pathway component GspD/PulD (secretin)